GLLDKISSHAAATFFHRDGSIPLGQSNSSRQEHCRVLPLRVRVSDYKAGGRDNRKIWIRVVTSNGNDPERHDIRTRGELCNERFWFIWWTLVAERRASGAVTKRCN